MIDKSKCGAATIERRRKPSAEKIAALGDQKPREASSPTTMHKRVMPLP